MTFRALHPLLEVLPFTDLTTEQDIRTFLSNNNISLQYFYFGKNYIIIHPQNQAPLIITNDMSIAVTNSGIVMGLAPALLELFYTSTVKDHATTA